MLRPALFIVYAVALAVATHWPALELGTPATPSPDKLIHLVAFAGLAGLLWWTGWFRRAGWFAAVALLWPIVDELTQAAPGLRRHPTLSDLIAGQLGVLIVLTWIWALRPLGAAGNRWRLAHEASVRRRWERRAVAWLAMAAGAAVGGLGLGGAVALVIALGLGVHAASTIAAGALAGGFVGAWAAARHGGHRVVQVAARAESCASCDASCATRSFDDHGQADCARCARIQWRGQWLRSPWLPPARRATLWRRSVLIAIAWAAAFAIAVLLIDRAGRERWPLPADLRLGLCIALGAGAIALAVRSHRRSTAALLDHQHIRCAACSHAVAQEPTHAGAARCPGCQRTFFVPPATRPSP